jgi:hypothetical protein
MGGVTSCASFSGGTVHSHALVQHFCQLPLGKSHRSEEFLQQHFTGMSGGSVGAGSASSPCVLAIEDIFIDEGGVRTVEIAEALGFGETTVRKLLTG